MQLESFGEKSINNLLDSIEESKNNSLEKLLFGLGIRFVGDKTAKILAKNYKNIDNLINSSLEDLINIKDIGDKIANSVYEYFRTDKNIFVINKLKEYGLNMEYLGKEKINTNFANNTFVITGTLEKYKRDELTSIIESLGGTVSGSVSKKTYAVILGENPGSKYDNALKLGIRIIKEEELDEMLKED